MSEMIERVAKAILDKMDLTDGLNITSATTYAKAAIEAMREPTEEMINAETEQGKVHWDYSCQICGGAKFAWQAMIDAALK